MFVEHFSTSGVSVVVMNDFGTEAKISRIDVRVRNVSDRPEQQQDKL
jgi:hypothetical protein